MNTKLLNNKVGDNHSDGVVQCSSVQWFQCSGLQCSGVQCNALHCSSEQCSVEQNTTALNFNILHHHYHNHNMATPSLLNIIAHMDNKKIFYLHSGSDKTNLTSLTFFGCFNCFKKTIVILHMLLCNLASANHGMKRVPS